MTKLVLKHSEPLMTHLTGSWEHESMGGGEDLTFLERLEGIFYSSNGLFVAITVVIFVVVRPRR